MIEAALGNEVLHEYILLNRFKFSHLLCRAVMCLVVDSRISPEPVRVNLTEPCAA